MPFPGPEAARPGVRNAVDEVAQRVPAVKTKKPEEFIDIRFLQEFEKEGFFRLLQRKN